MTFWTFIKWELYNLVIKWDWKTCNSLKIWSYSNVTGFYRNKVKVTVNRLLKTIKVQITWHPNYPTQAPVHVLGQPLMLQTLYVLDFGATNHMTSSTNGMSEFVPYLGIDSVTIANGSGLPISHIGSPCFFIIIVSFRWITFYVSLLCINTCFLFVR